MRFAVYFVATILPVAALRQLWLSASGVLLTEPAALRCDRFPSRMDWCVCVCVSPSLYLSRCVCMCLCVFLHVCVRECGSLACDMCVHVWIMWMRSSFDVCAIVCARVCV